jgi:hypothetical protein
MVDLRVRLPKEEAAVVVAALTAARDRCGTPPARAAGQADAPDSTPVYGYADALLDVARTFLDTAPRDRSGEDRTLVVVHVAAEQLTGTAGSADPVGHVPAGTPDEATPDEATPDDACGDTSGSGGEPGSREARSEVSTPVGEDVPAGTSPRQQRTEGGIPAQSDEARLNLVGDVDAAAEVVLGVTGGDIHAGDVPAGTSRPVDPTCHLHGLGGIEPETARRLACDADVIGVVVDADGEVLALGRARRLVSRAQRRPHRDWYSPDGLAHFLAQQLGQRQAELETMIDGVDRFDHPDAVRIQPGWRGERFDLHEAVQALFRMPVQEQSEADEAA